MNPKVMVAVVSYNHESFIEDFMLSLRHQIYMQWGLIFTDNKSTDMSLEIAKDEIKRLPRSNNIIEILTCDASPYQKQGIYSSLPLPLGMIRLFQLLATPDEYKYFCIVDADDWWALDKLKKQVDLFESDPDLGVVFSDCYYASRAGKVRQAGDYPAWFELNDKEAVSWDTFHRRYPPLMKDPFISLLTRYNFVPCPSLMFRTDRLKEVVQRRNFFYAAAEDYDWILRITAKYKCAYVPEPLAYHRVHERQKTRMDKVECTWEEIDVVRKATNLRRLTRGQRQAAYWHLVWLFLKLIYRTWEARNARIS
jgi:GT2 family glycosyltransferase